MRARRARRFDYDAYQQQVMDRLWDKYSIDGTMSEDSKERALAELREILAANRDLKKVQ